MKHRNFTILQEVSTGRVAARALFVIGLIVSGSTLAPAQTTNVPERSNLKMAHARVESLLREAKHAVDAGEFEIAGERATEAVHLLDMAEGADEDIWTADLRLGLGLIARAVGKLAVARQAFEKALAQYERASSPRLETVTATRVGDHHKA